MSLLAPTTISEAILTQLKGGERKTTLLFHETAGFGGGITKQAFYAALRKLKNEEVVVVYGGKAAINAAWIRNMQQMLGQFERSYVSEPIAADLPDLSQKESVSYTFSNTRHLDTFWGHSQTQIISRTPVGEAVYSYDPHYWFYIAREATERKLIEEITRAGRQFLMTAGGQAPLDRAIRGDFSDDLHQYHLEALFPKRSYYVVVIADYVTEVWLDPNMTEFIEGVYEKTESLDDTTRKQFLKLLNVKARHKIRITRNAKKAETLRRRMRKNFFVQSDAP